MRIYYLAYHISHQNSIGTYYRIWWWFFLFILTGIYKCMLCTQKLPHLTPQVHDSPSEKRCQMDTDAFSTQVWVASRSKLSAFCNLRSLYVTSLNVQICSVINKTNRDELIHRLTIEYDFKASVTRYVWHTYTYT